MPNSLYSVEEVSIEGFKAFTRPQSFRFAGKHVFLFGQNGLGKTSIVEAIRWCLFGLAYRQGQGETVKNQFYGQGNCIVTLTLRGPDGLWTLRRMLRPGSNLSDLTVRDPHGNPRNLDEVFPQLSRVGPTEGAHVIYAAQQASSKRPEADITDFRSVVFRYLGVEDLPRISDDLLRLDKCWKVKEEALSSEVNNLNDRLSERIKVVDESIHQIISNPPWGNSSIPDNRATSSKLNSLASDAELMGAECAEDVLAGLTLEEKLYEIDTAIRGFFASESNVLQDRLNEKALLLKNSRTLLEDAQQSQDSERELSRNLKSFQKDLAHTLKGTSLKELECQFYQLETELGTAQKKLDAVRSSRRYMTTLNEAASPLHHCPACNTEVQVQQVKQYLDETESKGDANTDALLQRRDELEGRIGSVKTLLEQQEDTNTAMLRKSESIKKSLQSAREQLGLPSSTSLECLGDFVEKLDETCDELESAVNSNSDTLQSWESRIADIRQELRYQNLRRRSVRLKNLRDVQFENLHVNIKDLGDFRDAVNQIRQKVNTKLEEILDKELPPVGEEMSDVFLRLTGNPTFDSIVVRRQYNDEGAITLELRVSSKRGAGEWRVDSGILNGQALNAVHLVPYLVFSRYQEGPLLDLLLLDDPTQAFDDEKVALLLEELTDATSHATLLVATHDEGRFLPYLRKHFPSDSITAYRAVGLGEDGPVINDISQEI